MTKEAQHWNQLSEQEQAKILSMLEKDPSWISKLTDSASDGDGLAAEALLAFAGDSMIFVDHEDFNRTRKVKKTR